VPAIVIGVFSAILLAVVSEIADKIHNFFWDDIRDWLNFNGNGDPWIIFMLTLTGVAVGGWCSMYPATPDQTGRPHDGSARTIEFLGGCGTLRGISEPRVSVRIDRRLRRGTP
jgi:hypothetical protein